MNINVKLARKAINKKNGQNHLVVEICPDKPKNKISKPNAFVFVIDSSGSMQQLAGKNNHFSQPSHYFTEMYQPPEKESRMEYAKTAIISFLNKLNETDKVGVVEFSSTANIVKDLTLLTNKNDIVQEVKKLTPCGMTNIDAGINLGKSLFSKEDLKKYNCKLLILSDGETNTGRISVEELSTMCLNFSKENITTSCMGIGVDYNSFLLNKMATNGGGYLYHIDTLEKLESIFKEELELSNSILAKAVELEISVPTYFEIEENLNNYYEKNEDDKKKIFVGDITGDRKVAISFKNNHRTEDATFNIKCKYKDLEDHEYSLETKKEVKVVSGADEFEKDLEVIEYVLSLIEANTNTQAMHFADIGNTYEANQSYLRSMCCVNNMATAYSLDSSITSCTLDSLNLSQKNCEEAITTKNKEYIKTSYSTSSSTTRK